MSAERLYEIIRKPVISEKAMVLSGEHNQVTFRVAKDATKAEIKAAVEKCFPNTKVGKVRVVNYSGKRKRVGHSGYTKRPAFKKAYVTLAEGTIDLISPE